METNMSYEMEHAQGTSPEAIKQAEKEFRKDILANKFGWSRKEFDEKLEEVKGFLTTQEIERRKKYGLKPLKRGNRHEM